MSIAVRETTVSVSHPEARDIRLPEGDDGLYLPEGESIIAQQFTAGLDS